MSSLHFVLDQPAACATGLDTILAHIRVLGTQVTTMNAKVQQLLDDAVAARASIRALTDLAVGIKTKLQGDSAVIAQLRIDLAAAIAALANAGIPATELQALQDVHDGLVAATAEVDADVAGIVSDITANTAP